MKTARKRFLIAATTFAAPLFGSGAYAQNSSWSLSNGNEYSQSELRAFTPWRDSVPNNKPNATSTAQVTRRDFTNALAQNIPILAFARDWRDTFRGTGALAKRSFKLMDGAGDNDLVLLVGAQQLPQFGLANLNGGTAAGLGVTWGKFSFGTTTTRRAFENIASAYDRLAEGTTAKQNFDQSTMTWMTLRPMEGKSGSIDVLFMRASRDMTPWQKDSGEKKMRDATSFGARTDLKLWSDWRLRGEWMNSTVAGENRAGENTDGETTSAWKIDTNGTLQNPLGTMQISLYSDSRDPNYAPIGDMNRSEGYSNTRVLVVQPVQWGSITGTLKLNQDSHENLNPKPYNGQETSNKTQEVSADFKWKMSPRISAVAKMASRDASQDLKTLLDDDATNDTSRQSAEAGFEWKLNNSMSLNATASQIHTDRDFTAAGSDAERRAVARLKEQRLALGISRRTKTGNWNVQVSQHLLNDKLGNFTDTSSQSLSLQAERQMTPNLRLRAAFNLNSDDDYARSLSNDRASQSVEAQWKVSSRSNLTLNYSNWDAEQARLNTLVRNGGDAMALKFNYGAARSGNGLGLSVEYAKRDTPNPDERERYRIGLTFK